MASVSRGEMIGMFGCGKMQMGETTGNGNDFVYGPAGISEALRETHLMSLTCADGMNVC